MNTAILEYSVLPLDSGKTAEAICRKKMGISSKLLKTLKLNGKLRINGEICRSVDTVFEGDVLTADVTENKSSGNIVPTEMKLDIIFEDEYIMVVNKPRKMSVHPSIGNFENTLANGIIHYWKSEGECHKFHAVNRIDKDTSGICVIAKNQYSHGFLSQQMKKGEFERRYLAIVKGKINPPCGVIDLPIIREENSVLKRKVSNDGKRAVTEYKTIKTNTEYSLIDVLLHTGRTHQIRVHFSHIGYPLVGDWLYGNGDKERDIAQGHLLHAYFVSFRHPKDNRKLSFCAELPKDMKM